MTPLNSQTFRSILGGLVLAFCTTIHAATEEWRYGVNPDVVQQLVADGEGGVALVSLPSGSDFQIVWLDFKGQEVFKKVIPQSSGVRILAASKRGLAYWIEGTNTIRFVDGRGRESVLGANAYPINQPYSIPFPFRVDDDSGIFVYELGTPAYPQGAIVRFKY